MKWIIPRRARGQRERRRRGGARRRRRTGGGGYWGGGGEGEAEAQWWWSGRRRRHRRSGAAWRPWLWLIQFQVAREGKGREGVGNGKAKAWWEVAMASSPPLALALGAN